MRYFYILHIFSIENNSLGWNEKKKKFHDEIKSFNSCYYLAWNTGDIQNQLLDQICIYLHILTR
jgi:hypothetical protein